MDLSKFVAIIPARGGSKGIDKKNIVDINGKPLISFTIEAAQALFNKEQIFVSTDSAEIGDISTKFGANVPFLRPQEISQDSSSSILAGLNGSLVIFFISLTILVSKFFLVFKPVPTAVPP